MDLAAVVHALAFAEAVLLGLMAGFFYAFSVCVMDALAQRPPAQAIAAMQAINRVVLNRLFLPVFVGLAPLSLLTAALALAAWPLRPALWLAAASLLYCAGTFAVTVLRSVPMNDALARVDADGADAAAQWTGYLSHWTRWNHVRSLSAVAALACALMGLRD